MIKVLIAEDNVVNRELLRELLESRGYSVSEACDGQEALDALRQTLPDDTCCWTSACRSWMALPSFVRSARIRS